MLAGGESARSLTVTVINKPHPQQSNLFTLRLWLEPLGDGRAEWRGQLRHVASGETCYFRSWSSLIAQLSERVTDGAPPAGLEVASSAAAADSAAATQHGGRGAGIDFLDTAPKEAPGREPIEPG